MLVNCMAFPETQQIIEAVKRSERPLLVLPESAGVDHFSSAFGLYRALQKLEKDPTIVCAGELPKAAKGLAGDIPIHADIPHLHDLTIEVDLHGTDPHELSYEVVDGRLRVHITPKTGMWRKEEVQALPSTFRYDLILCIGVQDLEASGRLLRDYADFFYRTPIINIDHAPSNEHFGQMNAVNMTAAACSEVCHELIEAIDPALVDEEIATHFMAGMIAKTRSFKTRHVTPKTLATASTLLAKGANREKIVHELYRTRSVGTLRLWGRALARLKTAPEQKTVWTLLSQQDFLHAGAKEEDLPDVIDELIANSPEAEMVLLLYENADHHVCGILRTLPPRHAGQLLQAFGGVGAAEEARICLTTMNIVEAERQILPALGIAF